MFLLCMDGQGAAMWMHECDVQLLKPVGLNYGLKVRIRVA